MPNKISVIYTIRDRNPKRIENSVKSLRKSSTISFKVIVVDYGSKKETAVKTENICKKNNIQLIRCESQGLPWCKSHALNITIRKAKTKFIVTTDIDMLFENDVLKLSLEKYNPLSVIRIQPLWLPSSGNKNKARLGNRDQLGGFLFTTKKTLCKFKGFNENIKFWGGEDRELCYRLKNKGYKNIWLNNALMYHVKHSQAPNRYLKPISAIIQTELENLKAISNMKRKTNSWGELITKKNRPILNYINKTDFYEIRISPNQYHKYFPKILKNKNKKLIKLIFAKKRTNLKNKIIRKFKTLVDKKINKTQFNNFEAFYISLPILKKKGLCDFYIEENYKNIYLLFN